MNTLNRTLVGTIAVFMLANGIGFWFALDQIAPLYNLSVVDPLARAGIRADFGGFFLAAGTLAAIAASQRHANAARAAAGLFILAIFGRFLSVGFDGAAPEGTLPMLVEGISASILLWSAHHWSRQSAQCPKQRNPHRTATPTVPQTVEA